MVDDICLMAEGGIEDSALAVHLRPNDGHVGFAVGFVRAACDGEAGGGEDTIGGIGMQIVLFTFHIEVFDSFRDWGLVFGDLNSVFHAIVAGVGDPLSAGEELPFAAISECVAHPAMASRHAHSAFHRDEDGLEFFRFDLAHRPDGDDEVEVFEHVSSLRENR